MAEVEILTGFRVYKDYSRRKGYNQDQLRRARNQYVIESLFGSNNKTIPSSKTRRLRKNLKALQRISDNFFNRIKLDPQVLESFKNILGPSFEYGTIDHESFLSSQKNNHFLLLKLLFETLSQNYDRILDLENQIQSLTDLNSNLNSYLLDVQDEMEKLRKYASDCNEMRVSEVGVLSEEYQMLYDNHSNIQEELNNSLQKNYYLENKIIKLSSGSSGISGSSGFSGSSEKNLKVGDYGEFSYLHEHGVQEQSDLQIELVDKNLQLPPDSMNLFDPILDDSVEYQNKLQEYEKKIKELKLSNDRLFEEKVKLTKVAKENFGSDKFVTLSLLFHQITKTFNKLFQNQNEVKRITADSENTQKLRTMLFDARINTLEYENRAYKQRLNEVEEILKTETVEKFTLDSELSHLKMDLYSSQEAYLKLENMNSNLLRSENELNLMRTSRDVYVEQLGKMQHLVTNLTRDKNELTATVSKMEYSKDTLIRELDVLKEQLKTMENLIMEQGTNQFDFKDKITNIQLQANSKILEDKLSRIKRQLDETRLENSNLITNMVELRNTLERVRRENSELGKTVAASLDNESRFTVDIQHLMDEVNSLKASLNRNALNFKAMSNEMSQMSKKLFEKNLQYSSLESRKDKVTSILNEFSNKLNNCKVVTVNIEELKKLDLKSLNYNELIHYLTGTNSSKVTNTSMNNTTNNNNNYNNMNNNNNTEETTEEEIMHNLTNLVNFNEFMVVLCVNLARELNDLTGNMLNVTSFSNIFETFKVEVIDPDMMKNQYLIKISDLELRLKNLEKLNGELGNKHVWEKSIIRIREKYEKILSSHKDVLRECRKLLRVNDKNLEILRQDNTRLASEYTTTSNLLSDTESKLSECLSELVHLKDLIYSLLPNELKFNASKDTPLKSIELLSNYLNTLSTAINMNPYSLYVSTSANMNGSNNNMNNNSSGTGNVANYDGRLGLFMGAGNNDSQDLALVNQHMVQNGQNTNVYGFNGINKGLEGKVADDDYGNMNMNGNNYNNNSSKKNKENGNENNEEYNNKQQNTQNVLTSNETRKELNEKVELLKYKEQLLEDVYDNVNYYCNLIVSDIKSQLGSEQQIDTDYESTKSNRDVQSDDTISDYKDEEYVVEKFEEVLNLLNKLFYQYNYNNMNGYINNNSNYSMNNSNYNRFNTNKHMSYEGHFDNKNIGNLVLDMNMIKSINKFVGTLKNYYNKVNNHNIFLLDDIEYEFESIPTIIDQNNKFRIFCSNLSKLLNIAGEFIYNQLNENTENMEQLMKKLEDNKGSIHDLEQMNMVKDQQLMSNQYEINELRIQLERIQELYDREKNNNREANFNLEKYEYELNRISKELNELTEKNHKLQLIVKEYEEVVQLLRR